MRPTWWRPHVALGLALCAWAAIVYARHLFFWHGSFTVDDAGITLAYADNLAHGHGFRITPGEAPSEGFSNFLQVLLLAFTALFGAPLDVVAKVLNVGAFSLALAGLSFVLWMRLAGWTRVLALAPFAVATYWAGFGYWVAAGLEGGLLAALQIGALLALVVGRGRRGADFALGTAAGLLAWCRPEALGYGAVVVAARLIRPARGRFRAVLVFGGLVLALVCVRFLVFRDVVPNTFWAKVRPGAAARDAGVVYLVGFWTERWWYFLVPLPFVAGLYRPARAAVVAAWGQVIWAIVFVLQVGGDWMHEWRFVQPALGPLVLLAAMGVLGLFHRPTIEPDGEPEALRWSRGRGFRVAVAFAVVWPPLTFALAPPGWDAKLAAIASRRNLALAKMTAIPRSYAPLWKKVGLKRRPLLADVDVGGLAWRSGLDVLDLVGLTDRVMARAWSREPGLLVDYLFGERLPDTIHLHGAWLSVTPVHELSPFLQRYRPLSAEGLAWIALAPVTAVRADLLDPMVPPVTRVSAHVGRVEVLGFSALRSPHGVTLFVHARQLETGDPPPLELKAADAKKYLAPFHAGVAVEPASAGAPLLARVELPEAALPIALEGAVADGGELRLSTWPIADLHEPSLAALLRQPLARLSGLPGACEPDRFIDEAAEPVRQARGVGLLARSCDSLPAELAPRYARLALAAARKPASPDERYEAATATRTMGVPATTESRRLVEALREDHRPFDEVLLTMAMRVLRTAAPPPSAVYEGLTTLLAARLEPDLLREAFYLGVERRPDVVPLVCTALRRLGLRASAYAADEATCAGKDVFVPVRRQGFEDLGDPALASTGVAFEPFATPRVVSLDGRAVAGGQGRYVAASLGAGPDGDAPTGELVWGPVPWSGRRFGALLAGDPDPALFVVVEGRAAGDSRWHELARVAPVRRGVLFPVVADLGERRWDEVRVRVVDATRGGHLVVDALTFAP